MKKIFKMLILLVVVSIVSNVAMFTYTPQVVAAGKSELQQAKDELNNIQSQQKDIDNRQNALKQEEKDKMNEKIAVEEKLNSVTSEISAINKVIYALDDDIAAKDSELVKVEKERQGYIEKFRERARASYERGETSYLALFLDADNISKLMTAMDLISQVSEYEKSLLQKLEQQTNEIKSLKDDIVAKQDDVLSTKNSLKRAQEQERSYIENIDSSINELNKSQEVLAALEKKYDELETALDEKISKLANPTVSYTGDELCWPLPGYSGISSGFGPRTLYGVYNYHDGIDIPAPRGTKIVAAEAGKVVYAQWTNTGGGYKVAIDHGGRFMSYYCHMSAFAVSVGQSVSKGQTIGYVGTTGNSTGNHLHFKIEYQGVAYNPRTYVNPSNSAPSKSIHSLIG